MLTISFAGWIQVRLATDPDPYDEPRGVSGYLRALPSEPDFDRIIRCDQPVAPRTHTPAISVKVTRAHTESTGAEIPALQHAAVRLDPAAKFEGRNGIVAEDGLEPIFPFSLEIVAEGLRLRRELGGQHRHPFRELWGEMQFFEEAEQLRVLGVAPAEMIEARREALAADLAASTDPLVRDGIQRRLAFLSGPRTPALLAWGMRWRYPLLGSATVEVEKSALPSAPAVDEPWTADFRIGVWDADALSAWMEGTLAIPLRIAA
jgi:hypothetical protein